MARLSDYVEVQARERDPIQVGDRTITLQSKAVAVHWPRGGWVWNRPVAAVVERDGVVERIPIVDVTRLAILALVGGTALLWLLALSQSKGKHKERKDDDGGTD
jgi:hypothetical protein